MLRKFLALTLVAMMLCSVVSCAASNETEGNPTGTTEETETTAAEDQNLPVPQPQPSDGTEGGDEGENEGNQEEPKDPPALPRMIDFVVGSKAEYTIVSDSPDYDTMAQRFATRLTQTTGVSFFAKKSADKKSVSGKKIQVGKKVSSLLNDDVVLTYDGILSVEVGKNIHLTAHHKDAVQRAMDQFVAGVATGQAKRDEKGSISFQVSEKALFFFKNPECYAVASPKLMGVPLSEFVIVIPEHINANEQYMARQLIHEIGLKTGILLKYVTDQTPTAEHEIVLGKTNRAASQTLYATLEDGYYVVEGVDGSVYTACDNYLVMDDARKVIASLCAVSDSTEINCSAKPDYAAQMMTKPSTDTIRVMSSNIICAADANAVEKYDVNGTTYQLRLGVQGRMIMDYLPDFVGMQEMQENSTNGIPAYMHTELLKTVGSEYSFVTYPELSATLYWTPILYRHTVWQIVEQDVLSSATFDNAMHRWQWAVFSRIDNPSEMYILLNLHYPTGRYVAEQLAAAALVNEQIKILKEKYPNAPIFVTGDFNARSNTETFAATFEGTGFLTANSSASAIDHVVYDPSLVTCLGAKFIENGLIHLTSDHRPFMADVRRTAS